MDWIMMGLEGIMQIFIRLSDFRFFTTIDTIEYKEKHNRPIPIDRDKLCHSIVPYCAYMVHKR